MEPGKNKFFIKALKQASDVIRNNKRLSALLGNVANKSKNISLESTTRSRFLDRVKVMGRLVKSYTNGTYRVIPWKGLLIIVGALIYFVTPLDLVPDFIPVTGLLDDFTVIIWVYRQLQSEIDEFIEWEHRVISNT